MKKKLFALAMAFYFSLCITNAQIVGNDAYIKGTSVEIGIDGLGGFEGCNTLVSPPLPLMHYRSNTAYFGFVANPQVDGWTNFDGDFFTPGTPENGWGIEIGTSGIAGDDNCDGNGTSGAPIPGSITNWSHIFNCYSCDWQGDLTAGTNLHVKINYFLQETDLFYTTTVSITNNTGTVIPDMYYFRNLDPDNNEELTSDYTTTNTIVSQPGTSCNLAHVSATQASPWNSYLGLAAIGTNWKATYGGFSNRDASDLYYGSTGYFPPLVQTVGVPDFDDEAIALAYRIQNLNPGATETFKFVVILDNAAASNAINNLLYLSYPGSLTAPPPGCAPYADTANTCSTSVPISVVGPSVGSYTWVWSPAIGLTTTTGPSTVANPLTTTIYTVIGTPTSSCYSPYTASITVQVTPGSGNNPYITPVTVLCVTSAPITLTADTLGGVWGGPGITNPVTGTFNPATAGVGTHLISYITPGLCNTTDTVLITVISSASIAITPVAPQCMFGAPFNLTSTAPGGTWSGTGITNASTGLFDPSLVTGSTTITYSVTVGACSSTTTTTISVFGIANSTITPHANVCVGSLPFSFNAATAGGTWSGTGITSATLGTYNPSVAGTFQIIYTIPGPCGSADTINMIVISPASAAINPVTPVCANDPAFNLTATTAGGNWSGTGITSGTAGTFNPATAGAGTFTITYAIGGACPASGTQSVTVNAVPTPVFTSDITSGCAPLCVNFSQTGSAGCINQTYNFGDGTSDSLASSTHCYTNAGVYTVSITCTNANGCTGTTTISNMITAYQVPTANFTYAPASPVTPGVVVNFTDVSTGGGLSFWNFGDPASSSNTSTLLNPSHTYATEGSYCVKLTIVNAGVCSDSVEYCIEVISPGSIFIPNIFSPNNDGTNDVFYITCVNIAQLSCTIYDRWGLKMDDWDNVAGSWNGNSRTGQKAPDGTYYYIIRAKANNGKEWDEKGYLQLQR